LAGCWRRQAYAETFKLANGDTLTGEMLAGSANDAGVQIKVGEGKYEKVPWANFSQEDLKKLRQGPEAGAAGRAVHRDHPGGENQEDRGEYQASRRAWNGRAPIPGRRAFFLRPRVFVLLLLYAANIYAGYEVSIFRARPAALVCGVSAVLPLIGPIIFLSLPTKMAPVEETWETAPAAAAEGDRGDGSTQSDAGEGAEHPTGLKAGGDGTCGSGVKPGQLEGG
jgi:hypothetical protein